MCSHEERETTSDDETDMDCCPRCEKRRDWADEDRRDYWDELAILRAAREDMSGIHDTGDAWY